MPDLHVNFIQSPLIAVRTYGKQKHLRSKKVVWPRKIVIKRSDMKVQPRLTMKRYKADQKQYIDYQQINLRN